tara:strand:+ start:56 stop:325 length:270 start_codon:yes stop_codon:yes gene_type:complete
MKTKVTGEGFKPFEVELKTLNLSQRAEINDMLTDESRTKNFSFYLDVIRLGTDLSDEELNDYSSDELIAMATKVYESANKKKLKKSKSV